MADSSSSTCANCGKAGATARCGRCKKVAYCDNDCQKASWRSHKKDCFEPDATCSRCLEPIAEASPVCRVPHPPHLVTGMGAMSGPEGCTENEQCSACGTYYSKVRARFDATDFTYRPSSAEWCYNGPHTTKPLRTGDDRRIQKDVLTIKASPTIQSEIDAIPTKMPDVRVLTIVSGGFGYDDSAKAKLTVDMPKLEQLRCIDVDFTEIKLHTPLLQDVEFQNVGDDCEFDVVAPMLKNVKFFYYMTEDETWLNKMLEHAIHLESFDSYKLRVGELSFASNHLKYIRLHRAEMLYTLRLYSPVLEQVNLQGCYSLEELKILDDHPLKKKLPASQALSQFVVDATNACLSDEVVNELNSNPRVRWSGPDVDDGVGAPMDAYFSTMNHMLGGM